MTRNWIFLRGLTRAVVHWGKFKDLFELINPNGIIEYIEIPGNGTKSNLNTPTDPNELIAILRKESRIISEKLDYNLCGISLGGMIALKWAELYPERLKSLSVINTSLNQYSSLINRIKPESYFKILKAISEKDAYLREKIILSLTCNDQLNAMTYFKDFAEFSVSHPIHRKNFFRQLLLAKRIQLSSPPRIPIHVICSEKDRLVSANCSRKIADHFNSKLYIHPTAGHDLPLDDPRWLANILISNQID